MKNNTNNNVAIVFDDLTEFFVMRDAIDDMHKSQIPVDIIVPHDSGYNGLSEHTFKKIKELGYFPLTDTPKNKTYQILLTPYPHLDIVKRLKHHYHIQYYYGAVSTKPTPVYQIDWKIDYHAVITFNNYEPFFLNAYGANYHIVPYWKYQNFHKISQKTEKPTLLILPTFGSDASCIDYLDKNLINQIKQHFHVVVKAHHAIDFNIDGQQSLHSLNQIVDEFYTSDVSIVDLLEKADVVLTDNSSSVFEAIYAGIPVATFAKDLNSRHLGQIDTLQYQLVQKGIIPYTNNPKKLLQILLSTKSYLKKQQTAKKELFIPIKKNSVKEFTKIIIEYINKDPSTDYHKAIHDLIINERNSHLAQIESLNKACNKKQENIKSLEKVIAEQDTIIQGIYNSTSWKITKPLRKIKDLKTKT